MTCRTDRICRTGSTCPRRLLSIEDAADYCGLSPSGFRDWMKKGRIPGSLPGTHRWDRCAIDEALDCLSGLSKHAHGKPAPETAFDDWKAEQKGAQGR